MKSFEEIASLGTMISTDSARPYLEEDAIYSENNYK
jgi:hypothetical protein